METINLSFGRKISRVRVCVCACVCVCVFIQLHGYFLLRIASRGGIIIIIIFYIFF